MNSASSIFYLRTLEQGLTLIIVVSVFLQKIRAVLQICIAKTVIVTLGQHLNSSKQAATTAVLNLLNAWAL